MAKSKAKAAVYYIRVEERVVVEEVRQYLFKVEANSAAEAEGKHLGKLRNLDTLLLIKNRTEKLIGDPKCVQVQTEEDYKDEQARKLPLL